LALHRKGEPNKLEIAVRLGKETTPPGSASICLSAS
jgi:hypothetical protein